MIAVVRTLLLFVSFGENNWNRKFFNETFREKVKPNEIYRLVSPFLSSSVSPFRFFRWNTVFTNSVPDLWLKIEEIRWWYLKLKMQKKGHAHE